MLVWLIMLVCDLLIPLTMLIFGILFIKRPPLKIGGVYGYRTRRSTSSPAAWAWAHRYFGRLWTILGAVLLPITAALMLMLLGADDDRVAVIGGIICTAQSAVMLIPIIPTELMLKRYFG